ncbi:caffeoyl-CoA O-methyltransferase-like isoform X2 [Vicia villosa]|uniref:caffeoyl-CoA O-methyltransferase-like isoform X2 n=1 Tax=Vicia villosa TaxID=3911 RepID=UPI00273BF99F|nr:caffeoyl-CoA O-methyltransferase-like isoform X2 [Vicia villosa]
MGEENQVIENKPALYKGLLNSDALYNYILETNVFPREHPCLKELREMTEIHSQGIMLIPADEGQFLSLLIKLMNAKKTMEIGVYTGYSLLSTALALPSDGTENNKGAFDFIFVDADKNNYLNYHKRVIELVKVGGLIGYDNTLWCGSVVAPPDTIIYETIRNLREYVIEFNKYIAQDSRFEVCLVSIGDGITLCRRIK